MIALTPLADVPMIAPGDDLCAILGDSLAPLVPRDGDVLVVAQKIVSKAEGRYVDLADVGASAEAVALGGEVGKDPRLVELILRESVRVVRRRPGLLIVAHRLGLVMANAGIDQSNLPPGANGPRVLLLPEAPDASAAALRRGFAARFGVSVGVIVSDSFGRAWRRGTVGVAIGVAGLPALIDLRGRADLFGRVLEVSQVGHADEISAAASLLMGQADEARPAVLVRGLMWSGAAVPAAALVRAEGEDLFR